MNKCENVNTKNQKSHNQHKQGFRVLFPYHVFIKLSVTTFGCWCWCCCLCCHCAFDMAWTWGSFKFICFTLRNMHVSDGNKVLYRFQFTSYFANASSIKCVMFLICVCIYNFAIGFYYDGDDSDCIVLEVTTTMLRLSTHWHNLIKIIIIIIIIVKQQQWALWSTGLKCKQPKKWHPHVWIQMDSDSVSSPQIS